MKRCEGRGEKERVEECFSLLHYLSEFHRQVFVLFVCACLCVFVCKDCDYFECECRHVREKNVK